MLRKARIAVFVSGSGTNLQALIDSDEIKSGELCLVVSNKADAYALKRAEAAGIRGEVLPSKGTEFDRRALELLESNNIDIVVLAGFLRVLGKEFVDRYENRVINIHPALIPSFCGKGMYGLKVHEAVLERGVRITGATVHYVNEAADGGEIILQRAVEVLPDDTPLTLQRRVMEEAEWKLLPLATELVCKMYLEDK
ncbi:MAG: phosphoribosylglycinamide formyltransferase [Eubacteriales bacterium]|nr:phosphoribosylglycinamide formyltransferase [Eubacteriales bacterium]MCI7570388.1 phosphoribosylglycinamide formyltransferase [Clostridiales bacterium]MDD7550601.1 phosphoribosylglycinamide formyltransferase [Clostridia bacterium]MDY5754183.1 phosphoribosylglycinamide formyltransferase [Eubacteriales bacterium]